MPLIVLEGLDGAGKSTQLGFLQKRMAEEGHATQFLHFPRVETPLYGERIAAFLRGDFGAQDEVDPYIVALLFAGDRAEAGDMLAGWLAEGQWVFLDRYVYSNVAFQCAKIEDPTRREELKKWIMELEFRIFGIPRPTVSLFLDVPFEFTRARLAGGRTGSDRQYLLGKEDIHESSLELQERVRAVYLEAAATDPLLRVVDCSNGAGEMALPAEIFERIIKSLEDVL
ncbi:MAG: dTMP kinase [Rikenellaceae bacterium]|jgi:dTMP kinase|nr:dTMP kinase [Rikenellaceae bacterium]